LIPDQNRRARAARKDKVIFGRAKGSDCVLSHPTVSREHFIVEHNNGKLFSLIKAARTATLTVSVFRG
jgi:hypothetical protein